MSLHNNFVIELLNKDHTIKKFTCGNETLNTYLKTKATQEIRKKITAVYIIRKKNQQNVIGFYTLSSSSIELTNLSADQIKKLPKYKSLPVILLGRLAVALQYQGKKIGEYLLLDSLIRSYNLSKQIGSYAVLIDAKDKNIAKFYKKYGFIPTKNEPLKLYLPMNTIKQLVKN